MIKYRFSLGRTPDKVIEKQLPDTYPMELLGNDFEVVKKLVNIGIDSRLQAVTGLELKIEENRAKMKFDKPSMVCLLNRLLDYSEFGEMADSKVLNDEQKQYAYDLRSGILTTLDIEEI
jgi:hypothetical protein